MEFGEFLRKVREEKGFSINQLATLSGISNAQISRIESGERGIPKPETIRKLSDALGIAYYDFMKAAGHITNDLIREQFEPYDAMIMVKLPVLGSIRAGEPIDRIEDFGGYTNVDPGLLRGREGFALNVKGDSMSGDRIMDGDVVIVVLQEEVQPHDIAVVAVNGDEATLKRVKVQGEYCMLIPSNPQYETQLVNSKDVHVIGKVVEVKFWPK